MGVHDSVLIANAQFPSYSFAKRTSWSQPLDLASGFRATVEAILSILPLAAPSEWPVLTHADDDGFPPEAINECSEIFSNDKVEVGAIPYQSFAEMASSAFAVIRTSDRRAESLLILKKGAINSSSNIE